MTAIYIIVGILIFGFLIIIHEFGHFITAKACGVRVNEFSVGMGPAVWKKQRGETLYALRAFPMGGYCAMEGEEEDSDDPRSLERQGFFAKLLIFVAGAAMNFIAGFLIVVLLYADATAFYMSTIESFAEGCPMQGEALLQTGDTLYAIDGERVYVCSDVSLLLELNKTGVYDLTVLRGDEKIELQDFRMEKREYRSKEGQVYTGYGLFFGAEEATATSRLSFSWNATKDFVRMVRLSLKMLVSGEAGLKDLSGPVGVVDTMAQVGQEAASIHDGLENILYLGALIAVNLAVMNLLPLPALDGGKIFFLMINAAAMLLFRKKIPTKYENYIHYAGLLILLAFMALVTCKDIWKLFT